MFSIKTKSIQIFFTFFIFLISTWIVFIYTLYYLEDSKFNHFDKSYEDFLNKSRKLQESSELAKQDLFKLLKDKNLTGTYLFNKNDANFLCVVVMSKKRISSTLNYVQQTLMALVTRTSLKNDKNVSMVVCDLEPETSENSDLKSLKILFKTIKVNSKIQHENPRVKEAADFSLIIKEINKLKNFTYILLLEDDALVTNNWYEKILQSLNQLPENLSNKWFCIKLFTGYKFFDWDFIQFPLVIIKILFYSFILSLIQLYICKTLNLFNMFIGFVLFVNTVSLLTFFTATSVNPVQKSLREYNTGFGAVSILISNSNSLKLANYIDSVVYNYTQLKSNFFIPKDLLISKFVQDNSLIELISEPSLVQHTGMHSSLYLRNLNDQGFKAMFKSYSFVDERKLIKFSSNY